MVQDDTYSPRTGAFSILARKSGLSQETLESLSVLDSRGRQIPYEDVLYFSNS